VVLGVGTGVQRAGWVGIGCLGQPACHQIVRMDQHVLWHDYLLRCGNPSTQRMSIGEAPAIDYVSIIPVMNASGWWPRQSASGPGSRHTGLPAMVSTACCG